MILGLSIGLNRPKTFVADATPIEAVQYNYKNTTSSVVFVGELTHNSPSLNIRISSIDANRVDHDGYLNNTQPGDTITVNGQTATIVGIFRTTGGWLLSLDAWPAMVDGLYDVTIFGPF